MVTPMTQHKPPARSKAILTPLGAWHAAPLKLLARLGAPRKVAK